MNSAICLLVATVCGSFVAISSAYWRLRHPSGSRARVKAFVERIKAAPIAHRGGTPENTLSAIRKSKSKGASGIEVDLVFTKDGHPVLLHDGSVDRTSNGRGDIHDMTLEEVKKLDFGQGTEHVNERIPTLYEAVELCKELDLVMFLDVKDDNEESVAILRELFSRKDLYDSVAVVSFYPRLLSRVRSANPDVLVGLTMRSNIFAVEYGGRRRHDSQWMHFLAVLLDKVSFWMLTTFVWRYLGVTLLLPFKDDVFAGRIDPSVWSKRGVHLVTWTVNDEEEKIYIRDTLQLPFMTDSV